MIYCMINDATFDNSKINISYCLINDLLEMKTTKKFNMEYYDNIICIRFKNDQVKDKNIENYIDEILNDFTRSDYIFGKETYEKYFSEINECSKLKTINEVLKYKYIQIEDILEKIQEVSKMKYIY